MRWLERHAWWALVAMATIVALFGLGDLLVGFGVGIQERRPMSGSGSVTPASEPRPAP